MRMEGLFHDLDGNQNGRLQFHELQGQYVLQRRLKCQINGSSVLLDDLLCSAASPIGPRLQPNFQQADRNRHERLNCKDPQAIPWMACHFERFDKDQDGKPCWQSFGACSDR